MVYGRLMFNNLKEYTPSFIKTVPYGQITKPVFGKQKQVQSRFMADPKVKRLFYFIQRNIQKNPFTWQVWVFMNAFIFVSLCYWPWRWVYSFNNTERGYQAAVKREKEWKAAHPE